MPDESVAQAGSRFARDMKRIREARGISRSDIHEETMISVELIRSFEERGLVDHPSFNRVYLRSFVRSLAQCTDIDPAFVVQELERALNGRYTNQLAVEYLDEEPVDSSADSSASDETPEDADSDSSSAPPQSPESGGTTASSGRTRRPRSRRRASDSVQVAIAAILGLIIVAGLLWLAWTMLSGDGSEATPQATSPPDTAAEAAAAPVDTSTTPRRPVLGDTMYVTVVAGDEKIDPIRIRRDTDLRRPYYIEAQQAAVFPAQDSVILERELSSIRVLLNGYAFPIAAHRTEDAIRITRASAQAFLDTAELERPPVPAVPDTFAVLGP